MTQDLLTTLRAARDELGQLRRQIQTKRGLDRLRVSDETNRLIDFRKRYQARLLARVTTSQEDFALRLEQDVKERIGQIVALLDYAQAHQARDASQIDGEVAAKQYNERAQTLDRFLEFMQSPKLPFSDTEPLTPAEPNRIAQTLRGQSEREIFQVVSRTVPVDPALDEELSITLAIFIRWCHSEPAVARLITQQNGLTGWQQQATYRAFAASQALRDYVAPYLSALIKKALSAEGVEAFDDAFRNTYFAVVNRVINYYQTQPKAADRENESGSKNQGTDGVQTRGNVDNSQLSSDRRAGTTDNPGPPKPSGEGGSQKIVKPDSSATATPLPPFDESEPVAVKTLLSAQDVEAIEHEDLDSLADASSIKKAPKKVRGTGLD